MHWRCFFVWCDCVFFFGVFFSVVRFVFYLRRLKLRFNIFFLLFYSFFRSSCNKFSDFFFRFLIYFGTHLQIEWDGRFSDSINSIQLLRTCVCWRRLSYAWEKNFNGENNKTKFWFTFRPFCLWFGFFFLFLSLMHLSFPSSAANKILYAETQETDSKNDEHYNTRDEIAL